MGILNLNEDSFFSASRTKANEVTARAARLFEEGADVIDLGACSTRPGSTQPDVEEEWKRLQPALRALPCTKTPQSVHGTLNNDTPCTKTPQSVHGPRISIDTFRAEIVRRTYDTIGPFLVNDISAGHLDPEMLETVGRLGLPYVAMHMRGTPENMQQLTDYPDIVKDIEAYFREFAQMAEEAGIKEWILDPGFGFAKTIEQNYELMRRMNELKEAFPQEILVGVSRKSMIYKVLGITPEEAMPATQVLNFAALERGATWLRVHDVAPAVQTAQLYSTMYTSSPGAAK
ncbi:MAG: dihydropteroate synthase [Bacteroidales bacterium]|nr:dihydropteroate synthase [Bacteroidales bacterium]